jgi:hypothetical protein
VLSIFHLSWVLQRWLPLDQYRFADYFYYHNNVPGDAMLERARMMPLLLSVLFVCGVSIFLFLSVGPPAALAFAALWSFSPTILTHATLVATDFPFAVFFFLFFLLMANARGRWAPAWQGAALGLCYGSKYLAIVVIPFFVVARALDLKKRPLTKSEIKEWAFLLGTAVGVLAILYAVTSLPVFVNGLSSILGRTQRGRSSFLCGLYSTQGWWWYFPFAFGVKSTGPELLALAAVVISAIQRKRLGSPLLWVPPVLFFLLACSSKVQIGHRHILVIYPFLFYGAALVFQNAPAKMRWVGIAIAAWMAGIAFSTRPYFLSYFNEAVGGPANGYRYLTDSNVDWGQSLKELGESLEPQDHENGIYLSYFGVGDPHAYGIRYLDIGSDSIAGHKDDSDQSLKPTKFAVSITNLQATYYGEKNVFTWLKDLPPWKRIGHSIFVYDLKDQPEMIKRLDYLRTMAR